MQTRIRPIAREAAPAIASIFVVTPFNLFTKLSQLRATAVPIEAAPANIKPTPNAVPAPVKARIAPIASAAAPTISKMFVTVFLTSFVIEFQFKPTVAANPTAPTANIPIPRPVATPVNARIAPIPSKAPLTIAVRLVIELERSPVRESQLRATADTRDTAPAAIIPTPSGIFTPVKASIAPKVNKAPPTIPSSKPIVFFSGLDIASQFKPTVVANPTAPAAIRAIPSGTETPVKANNAPIASKPPLTIPVRIDNVFDISPLRNFQLIAAAVASEVAPATIRPAPRGTFTPENARNAPMANKNPPKTEVTVVSTFASLSDIASQFEITTEAKPTAPAAIKPSPRGMFAPVTTRIVPIANINPLQIAVISFRASVIIFTISSTLEFTRSPIKSYSGSSKPKSPPPIPPTPPAPPPLPRLELSLGEMMFNSSIPSRAFLSFFAPFAALPRPFPASPALSAKSPTALAPALTPL